MRRREKKEVGRSVRRVVLHKSPIAAAGEERREEEEEEESPLIRAAEQQERRREAILQQMSEPYRNRAKKILEKIWPYLRLDEAGRVLYWSAGRETIGSDIVDLLKSFVGEIEVTTTDRKQFASLLKMAGVQKSDLAKMYGVGKRRKRTAADNKEEEVERDKRYDWIALY